MLNVLSMEQVFRLFDKDGNGTISQDEAVKSNKNMVLFGGKVIFNVRADMQLATFESENLKAYQEYEQLNDHSISVFMACSNDNDNVEQ